MKVGQTFRTKALEVVYVYPNNRNWGIVINKYKKYYTIHHDESHRIGDKAYVHYFCENVCYCKEKLPEDLITLLKIITMK